MSDQTTTIFGESDDLIEFQGGICEEFNDFDPQNGLLECSDGTRLRVSYPWTFELLHKGPLYIMGRMADDEDDSDRVVMGPIDWVKYTNEQGETQRAYRKGLTNPVTEIRKLIERYGEEAAERIQQMIEKRQARA